MSDGQTHVIKAKCMRCGLHFAAFSWHETWRPHYCPECGTTKGFMIWREESPDFIFQHVPGETQLAEMM